VCLWMSAPKSEQIGLIVRVEEEGSTLKYIIKLEKELQEWKDRTTSWEMLAKIHRDDIKSYWIPLVNELKKQSQNQEDWIEKEGEDYGRAREEVCDGVNLHNYEYVYSDLTKSLYKCTVCDKEVTEWEDTGAGG